MQEERRCRVPFFEAFLKTGSRDTLPRNILLRDTLPHDIIDSKGHTPTCVPLIVLPYMTAGISTGRFDLHES